MSYWHTKRTAGAKAYLDQREAETRIDRRTGSAGNRMMACGLTCQQWIDQHLKRNLPAKPAGHNTESEHDDENGREVTGPQAGSGGAGESLGDAPGQQAAGGEIEGSQGERERAAGCQGGVERQPETAADWIEQAIGPSGEAGQGWADEAYFEGQGTPDAQADFTSADRTPF